MLLKLHATPRLTIQHLAELGEGIAELDGQRIYVVDALPGEEMTVTIREKIPQGWRAEVVTRHRSSSERQNAPCPHFGVCGGCQLQHLQPAAYQHFLAARVAALWQRAGLPEVMLEWRYLAPPASRRRVTLSVARLPRKTIIGMQGWHRQEIIPLSACPVMTPGLWQAWPSLTALVPQWLQLGDVGQVQITELESGTQFLLRGGQSPKPAQALEWTNEWSQAQARPCQMGWQSAPGENPVALAGSPLPLMLPIGAMNLPLGAFLQATKGAEESLQELVAQAVQGSKGFADLYCGVGSLTPALQPEQKFLAADVVPSAIAALRHATKQHRHAVIQTRDLHQKPVLPSEFDGIDTVLIDPPRAGAEKQMLQIGRAEAVKKVISVSCDAASFVSDAKLLWQAGFRTKKISLLDQFLWSTHLELASVFER